MMDIEGPMVTIASLSWVVVSMQSFEKDLGATLKLPSMEYKGTVYRLIKILIHPD